METQAPLRRRLLAILAADVEGYSRLMAQDECGTLLALDAARDVFRAEAARCGGRVVDTAGDSVLAAFDTASGAVDAALAIQRRLEGQRPQASPAVRFRIGVHLGDVIEKDDGTIYGDGVNVAARLQAIAVPGGITVSQAVRGILKPQLAAVFDDLGEQTVKNIAMPVRVYRLRTEAEPPEVLRFGPVHLDLARRQLLVDDRPVALERPGFELLVALALQGDKVVARQDLIDILWPGGAGEDDALAHEVHALRQVLGQQAVATVPGRGYRLGLLAGHAAPDAAPHGPADAPSNPPGAPGLPPAPDLVGREDDLRALAGEIERHRLVTLLGPGGIGKTSLAVAAAHGLQQRMAHGAFWVDLAPLAEPALLLPAVGRAVGVPVTGRDPLATLLAGLAGRRALLVLDNAEHLLDAVGALVSALYAGLPELRLLVTSQAALGLASEHRYALDTLDVPASGTPASEAIRHGAVALFVAQAQAADRRFRLGEDNIAVVIDICTRLDGLALAIKLAAARVRLLGLTGLQQRLSERLRLLAGGAKDVPLRQQTLRAALDWSHGLLSAPQQRVFRRLGVFMGSFALDLAAKALADADTDEWELIEQLGSLVDRSLVVVEAMDPPRYRLLESAREYALMQLATHDDKAACHAQVAAVLQREFAEQVQADPAMLALHLSEGGMPDAAAPHWEQAAAKAAARMAYVEAIHHLERAIADLQAVAAEQPGRLADMQRAEIPLLQRLGSLHMLVRGIGSAEAQRDHERALALASAVGGVGERFIASFNLWFVFEAQLRFDRAGAFIEQTRELAEQAGDERFLLQSHHARWTTAIILGDFGAAVESTQEGYRLYRPVDAAYHRDLFVGHDPGICSGGCEAYAQYLLGHVDASDACAERTRRFMRATDHLPSRVAGAFGLCGLGQIARDAASVLELGEETLAVCRRMSLTQYIGLFSVFTGWALAMRDPGSNGADMALEGVTTFASTGTRLRRPMLSAMAADACRLSGRYEQALLVVREALTEIRAHGEHGWLSLALLTLAAVHADLGQLREAEQVYEQALGTAQQQKAVMTSLRAALGLAEIWRGRGESDRGRALIEPLMRQVISRRDVPELVAARAWIG